MDITAMMINENTDNVGVITAALKQGDIARFRKGDKIVEITLRRDVPIYHKFCVTAVKKGEPVIKYGEHLGIASENIEVGDYVHTHNLASQRDQ